MALEIYRAKRNFRRTPEPSGRKHRTRKEGLSFVVQKHAASRLHYDFRLELRGVLLSWAIPKGPSLDPADKRLAVHVEDHPLEYGGFEGVIPGGEYGGGTVMVWDRGTWTPEGDPVTEHAKGHLKFTLAGEKLRGAWALVRTGGRYGGKAGDKAWLLIKEKDDFARTGNGAIVDAAPDSVVSGRDLDEIARDRRHVWSAKRSPGANVRAGAIVAPAPMGTKARMPAMIAPMLATLVRRAPEGADWINEIKYDGYRLVCRIARGRARLFTRNGKDWTKVFPRVARDLAALPVTQAWIDGEVVVLDADGRTSFQALQDAQKNTAARGLAFFAFDLLYHDGYDLRRVALTGRRQRLRALVGKGAGTVRLGPETRGASADFFRQACALRLEGAVCKRADSPYAAGTRSRDWVKVKCVQRQEMVIGGYTDPQGARKGFGALLLGYYDGGVLHYAGKVGTGFDDALLRALAPQLAKRGRAAPPFANPPRGFEARGAHWVRPDLVAEVAFTEWSDDGALRHPSFQGLRPDKNAEEVVRETPKARTAPAGRSSVSGIALSNPGKLYFPKDGYTKRDLAHYYASVAPRLLPHLRGRPLSLLRCPDGWEGQCFYQKHADPGVDKAVSRVEVPEVDGSATYLGANSAAALVGLVQWGVIELHPWSARAPRLERPDRLIFDFDPDEKLAWTELVTAVGLLRTLLDEIGLIGFLKTTGGKGLHVVVPIRATLSWDEAKGFAKAVADTLARAFPDRFTATLAKDQRKGKIFIDYLRNTMGATAIAPYAVRARAGAPVAMPIDWKELARDVRFAYFNIGNAVRRLAGSKPDPWGAFFTTRQTVSASMRKRLT
jgi:bifunctional non-homologous end joining protein LigD